MFKTLKAVLLGAVAMLVAAPASQAGILVAQCLFDTTCTLARTLPHGAKAFPPQILHLLGWETASHSWLRKPIRE